MIDNDLNKSLAKYQKLAVSSQGLTSKQPFGLGIDGTLQTIKHLGYVQVDTLSVVERAHHHVLWNRVPRNRGQYTF